MKASVSIDLGKIGILFLLISFPVIVWSQTERPQFSIESLIQWNTMELVSTVKLDMASAGLRLPTGRAHGEELLSVEFPRIVAPFLFSIPVDSSTTIETIIQQGQLSMLDIDTLVENANKSTAVLDFSRNSLNRRIAIPLTGLASYLVRHQVPSTLPRLLIPQAVKDYTGIIIFAQDPLPIHGRQSTARLNPCLFPKIWDSDMNLIFERNMVFPEVAKNRGIVRYTSSDRVLLPTPSGLGQELQDLVGDRPLRILADKVFGKLPTDPVISKTDAQTILSSENNRRLLQEGRVVIVIDNSLLVQNFTVPKDSVP